MGGGIEGVEHDDIGAERQQAVDHVAADEPGTTGDEHPHCRSPRREERGLEEEDDPGLDGQPTSGRGRHRAGPSSATALRRPRGRAARTVARCARSPPTTSRSPPAMIGQARPASTSSAHRRCAAAARGPRPPRGRAGTRRRPGCRAASRRSHGSGPRSAGTAPGSRRARPATRTPTATAAGGRGRDRRLR